jgi:hypothetical protein
MLGYEAAAWLCHRLARKGGKVEAFRRTLPTVFEVNGTTAAPRVEARVEEDSEGERPNRGKKRSE